MYGDYLCYGQFDRDFIDFLQRRKREQEEELQIISSRVKLKETVHHTENIIEASRVYSVRNELVLQELSELKEKEIVTKTLSSNVFNNLQDVLWKAQVNATEDLWQSVNGDSPLSQSEERCLQYDEATQHEQDESETVKQESGSITDPEFSNHLEATLEKTLQQIIASTPEDEITCPESPEKETPARATVDQQVEIVHEILACEKGEAVSKLDRDFKNQLNGFLLYPPEPPVWSEPEVKGGRDLGNCYIIIGSAEVQRGNMNKAHMAYSEALTIGEEEGDKELQWRALDGLGTVAGLSNDFENSTKNFTAALYLLDRELSTVDITSFRNYIVKKIERL